MNKDAERLWELMLELGRRRSLRDPLASLIENAQLTPPQVHAIAWLGVDGALPISTVATRIGTSAPGATGLVDRLEKNGYVERGPSPSDRRVVLVTLTPAGEELAAQVISAFQRKLDLVTGALSPADRKSLLRLVTHVADALSRLEDEDKA